MLWQKATPTEIPDVGEIELLLEILVLGSLSSIAQVEDIRRHLNP